MFDFMNHQKTIDKQVAEIIRLEKRLVKIDCISMASKMIIDIGHVLNKENVSSSKVSLKVIECLETLRKELKEGRHE